MEDNELALNAETPAAPEAISGERYFVRLNYSERAQHMIFAGCFFILVFTGFMLKLPEGFLTFFGEILIQPIQVDNLLIVALSIKQRFFIIQ